MYLRDGRVVSAERRDYEGFHTRPMSWATADTKFTGLATSVVDSGTANEIADRVRGLAGTSREEVKELLEQLGAAIAGHHDKGEGMR